MKARLDTQRARIAGVRDRWVETYDEDDIWRELGKLDLNTATAAQVDAIIGNNSWTIATCSACKKQVENVVIVGDEPDYESLTAYLCCACACEAVAAFSNFGEKQVSITKAYSMIAPGQEDT